MTFDIKMKYYMTPVEDLTGYTCRSAYHTCYYSMDEYFVPFPSPKINSSLGFRELGGTLSEYNQGMCVVPQILTNQAEDFIRTAKELQEYGYSEINLNLGCPSGTTVSKYKGTGFLGLPDSLDWFLGKVCGEMERMGVELSVKTGLGLISPDEFTGLLEIYNRYPLKELIFHPRVRTDYHKSTPSMPAFDSGFGGSRAPVCYNGDIFTVSGYEALYGDYPELNRVMLGRGIISNPGPLGRIAAGADPGETEAGKETLRKFHQMMYKGYRTIVLGDGDVPFKMKELWTCMIQIFSDSGKYVKGIKKSQRLEEHEIAVAAMLQDLDIMEGAGFHTY